MDIGQNEKDEMKLMPEYLMIIIMWLIIGGFLCLLVL